MSYLTLQPRFWATCVLQYVCDSPFDSSVKSTHRLVRLWRSGSVVLSSRERVAGLERVDRQKMVVFGGRGVSRLELSVASGVQCVPSLEL